MKTSRVGAASFRSCVLWRRHLAGDFCAARAVINPPAGRRRHQTESLISIFLLVSGGRLLQSDVARSDDRVEMNSNRIRHATRISARKRGRYWDSPVARMLTHEPVALLQAFDRQRQSAE